VSLYPDPPHPSAVTEDKSNMIHIAGMCKEVRRKRGVKENEWQVLNEAECKDVEGSTRRRRKR